MSNDSSFWCDRPTLVTGATGLLGSWLVPVLLERRAHVVCLVRDWVPGSELVRTRCVDRVATVRGDICDQALLERALGEYEVDTVFHLAGQTIVGIANRNPLATFETNIGGTWGLLEACRRSPTVKQVVVASSDKAYGEHETLPYDESAPLQGRHPYDVSKSCADLISQAYAASFALPVAIARCGNLFGGGDLNWNRLVPGTIRSVLRGEAPVIRSDGQFVRDYLYVEDAVSAYLLLAERLAGVHPTITGPSSVAPCGRHQNRGQTPTTGQPIEESRQARNGGIHPLAAPRTLVGEAFNFSHEVRLTVLEVVNCILALMDSRVQPDVRNEASNEIPHQYLSSSKARRELGWTPNCDFETGMRRTIEWYRGFLKEGSEGVC